MLVETSHTLQDPSGKTLYAAWNESSARKRAKDKKKEDVTDENLTDTRIGSGSDHTVFLNFIGMPVMGLDFDGPYGVYHSMYDDFYWMNHFGDPGYRYHTLMSQLWGVLALRLANADFLPFDFAAYARHLRKFVSELPKSHESSELDLQQLLAAVGRFEAAGKRLDAAVTQGRARGNIDSKQAEAINRGMTKVERKWSNADWITCRTWVNQEL